MSEELCKICICARKTDKTARCARFPAWVPEASIPKGVEKTAGPDQLRLPSPETVTPEVTPEPPKPAKKKRASKKKSAARRTGK